MPNYLTELSPDNDAHVYQIKDIEAFPREEQAVLGAKNLLPLEISKVKAMNVAGTWSGNSYTRKGITYNCNVVNGFITQITASGTASEDAVIDLLKTPAEGSFMRRNVTLSGCPFGGSISTYFVNAYRIASTDGSTGTKEDTGNGVTFDFLNDGSGTKASISIVIKSGITANNLVFAPMLRLASDPDDTYVPYAMTNRELTDMMTVQESAVTNIVEGATIVSDLGNHLLKVGKVVYLSLSLSGVNIANAWGDAVFYIPEGYRPKYSHQFKVCIPGDARTQISSAGKAVFDRTLSNGTIYLSTSWITP